MATNRTPARPRVLGTVSIETEGSLDGLLTTAVSVMAAKKQGRVQTGHSRWCRWSALSVTSNRKLMFGSGVALKRLRKGAFCGYDRFCRFAVSGAIPPPPPQS